MSASCHSLPITRQTHTLGLIFRGEQAFSMRSTGIAEHPATFPTVVLAPADCGESLPTERAFFDLFVLDPLYRGALRERIVHCRS
jgi:hypothetical protein